MIDDDASIIMSQKYMVKKIKPEMIIDEAYSGEEAIKKCQKNFRKRCCNIHYKLIITDIYMRKLDGFETAKLIN
jgi:CheY-like chemotaxis protein